MIINDEINAYETSVELQSANSGQDRQIEFIALRYVTMT